MKRRTNAAMMLTTALLLQACASAPLGPTVQVIPAPRRPFEAFQQDDFSCRQFASGQTQGQARQANNMAVGGAVLGTVLGAGLGAALGGGRGAAIGAAGGAVIGTGAGAGSSAKTQYSIQQQYDIAYVQCMVAKGNRLPPQAPIYVQPAPIYVQPEPVYLAPPPYYVRPRYQYGY